MRLLNWRWVAATVILACSLSHAQKHSSGYPQPPEPAERNATFAPADTTSTRTPQVQPLELQREAKELLELTQSVQPDVESVSHGVLPKDTIEKLKRIEKLAKHLRGEIAP